LMWSWCTSSWIKPC